MVNLVATWLHLDDNMFNTSTRIRTQLKTAARCIFDLFQLAFDLSHIKTSDVVLRNIVPSSPNGI